MKKKLVIFGKFVGHLVMGAFMFISLALVSGSLSMFSHWYGDVFGDEHGAVLRLLETGILYVDMIFVGWWVIFSTYKATKDL